MRRSDAVRRSLVLQAVKSNTTVLVRSGMTKRSAQNLQHTLTACFIREYELPVVVSVRRIEDEYRVYAHPFNELSPNLPQDVDRNPQEIHLAMHNQLLSESVA